MKSIKSNPVLPTQEEMESLFINNVDLNSIRAYLNRFNPIKVMRMEQMEIRHSAVLSWLLNPIETHGLGDEFLKSFLSEALRGEKTQGGPAALEIMQSELRDTEVRREWENIDILLVNSSHQWAFIIENKFHSKQHANQLKKYKEKIQNNYDTSTVQGIFLTLQDEEPHDESYVTIRYEDICNLLSDILERNSSQLAPKVETFLNHYLEVIKEAANMSDELKTMEKLAKDLYRKHKKVLDFVIEHGSSSEFAIAARSIFGEDAEQFHEANIGGCDYVFCGLSNNTLSLLPKSWYSLFENKEIPWGGCENWWAGFPVIIWLRLFNNENGQGTIRLFAEVGPISNHAERVRLISFIESLATERSINTISFQTRAKEEGMRYSKFFKKNKIAVKDMQDAEEIEKEIKTLLGRFHKEFDIVAAALTDFIKFFDEQRQSQKPYLGGSST